MKNTPFTITLAANVRKKLGIRFKKTLLLEAALRHPSHRHDFPAPHLENFDRLEFYGDAVLNLVICKKIFKTFPIDNEGMLSRLRSVLVSKKVLTRVARSLGFLKLICIGKSLKNQPGFSKNKILADSFESFLAALYLDQGFSKAEAFILKHFDSYFCAKKLFRLDPNPKSMLQEICQKKWQKLPTYISHSDEAGGVMVTVTAHGKHKASAHAKTRRLAEEKAAGLLVRKLGQDFLRPWKSVSSGRKLRKTF